MLEALVDVGLGRLTPLLENVWLNENELNDWKRRIIIRMPTKSQLSECSNGRGITLLSVPDKLLSNIIYDRIKNEAQGVMKEEQAGFRTDGGCSDHIFALWQIIEQCEEWHKSTV